MKESPTTKEGGKPSAKSNATAPAPPKIHPVVIYPFQQPTDYGDLEELYGLIAKAAADTERFARPITVMDRKTFYAWQWGKKFVDFRESVVARHSQIVDAWCVDTCQMWYTGLGAALEQGAPEDVYWLIPGDFNYGTPVGQEVLGRLPLIPDTVLAQNLELSLGEIAVDPNGSKQIIDAYGTFALLYNWFPMEAQEIRRLTHRPRSEFFAIRHGFLREALTQRWFAYEQTLVLLLKAIASKKRVGRLELGDISDLPAGRDSLGSAMQQVERTERVLKMMWRDLNQQQANWAERFRLLDIQSQRIREAALIVLQNLLR